MAMHRITDDIWVGSMMSLTAVKTLSKYNITHILSVVDIRATGHDVSKFSENLAKNFRHLYLEIQDVEEEDIMQFFQQTNEFIDDAVSKGGSVLVHCIAGISRSATCACAYIMKKNKWKAAETIEYVKSKRPIANPNKSFVEQLEIYYQCGYEISDDKKPYREWKLRNQAEYFAYQQVDENTIKFTQIEMPPLRVTWRHILGLVTTPEEAAKVTNVRVNEHTYAVTEPIAQTVKSPNDSIQLIAGTDTIALSHQVFANVLKKLATRTTVLRCKSCSTTVATSAVFVAHKPASKTPCQHYFLEPIEWMRPELEKGELEGRIDCPNCSAKLGSYLWQGSRCSCGEWITPAIKMQKSRVDEMVQSTKPLL